MKHTKKNLAVLMAISILLCSIIAITSFAANSSQGDNEAEIEELQPVMARGCGQWIDDIYYNATFLGEPNSSYLDESGSYNKKYYFDLNGYASMVIHYSGHHGHPNPHYHTFSACYNERLGGLCWTESSEYKAWIE